MANGEEISTETYNIDKWMTATVPGTVLTSLLNNHKIPDPYYGMNSKQIPDIYNTGREAYTYWFVKNFTASAKYTEQVWLDFRGINYSFTIYVNGKLVEQNKGGMFWRHSYNITARLNKNGKNRLALIVYPPDPVGEPNGGQGGDGTIAHNVCNQYVAGWDWIQPIADRNTGIWDKVFLTKTGPVRVSNTHVVTEVAGVRRVDGPQAPATITVTGELENGTDKPQSGLATCTINKLTTSILVTLLPHEKKLVGFPVITLSNPALWWPNGYGPQNLYECTVAFSEKETNTQSAEKVKFGVRQIEAIWNAHTTSRELKVNGQPVFLKGGNWILSDAMLRLNSERYDAEIRMHRDMNLNLIRVWGGGITERPEFYDACDKYGILVLQDFWVSGDCNGRWYDPLKKEDTTTRRNYPDDHQLFIASVADQVKMLRNHPSLAIWCGGNEIKPPADILRAMEYSILPTLDGTRFFFEYSNDDSMSLNSHDGPYTVQPTNYFWQNRSYPFNSEIGSVGIGELESLERFLPEGNLNVPYYSPTTHEWIVDSVWRYHKFYGYDSSVEAYGHPNGIKDFTRKAQLVNYVQYRELMESFAARMWNWYTGIIIWKTQNPWTAMVGQMYDVYLDPNACLYGLKEAAKPIHIIYNPVTAAIFVANNTFAETQLQLVVKAVSKNGKELELVNKPIAINASTCDSIGTIAGKLPSVSEYPFLILELRQEKPGSLADQNIYWLPEADGSYAHLQDLKTAPLKVSAKKDGTDILVTITNSPTNGVSFFNRLNLINASSGKQILPAFYSDNYITIFPGQSKIVVIKTTKAVKQIESVSIEGWNTDKIIVPVKR